MAAQAGRLARAPAAAAAAARLALTASAARQAPLAALRLSTAAPAAQLRALSGPASAPRRGAASRPAVSSPAAAAAAAPHSWRAKMLYDGDCPLCCREVDMLRRRDAGRGRIAFVDLAAPDYSEAEHGVSYGEFSCILGQSKQKHPTNHSLITDHYPK